MDSLEVDILQKILSNCNEIWNINSTDEWKTLRAKNQFPTVNNNVLNSLITSIIHLLSYKVPKVLKQRYEVRLSVIEILRAWSRLKGSLSNLNTTFLNGENIMIFVMFILEKYLTDQFLKASNSVEALMTLYGALIYLLPKNPSILKYLHRIVFRLADTELTEESERLLISILESKESFEVDDYLLERIYASQKIKFIEIPLKNAFVSNFSKLADSNNCKNSVEQELDKLITRIVQSPLIFRLACSLLNDIFLATKYSQETLNFIKIVLQCIINRCEAGEKDIVHLYPANLQSCVILLRIEPSNHSKASEDYTLTRLKDIFLKSNEDALILLSHFPAWLEIFSSFLVNNGYDLSDS